MKKIFTIIGIVLLEIFQVNAQNCIDNSNSITFDGSSTYLSIANQTDLNITDSVTIEAWIYSNGWALTSAQNSIACKHGWSSGEGGFVLRTGGTGELSFNIAGLDVNSIPVSWVEVVSPTSSISLNTWTHVAGTYDGQNLKVYINGSLVGTTPFIGSIVASPNYPLTIGKLSDPVQFAQRFFNGEMDEVRVWHRALSQAELQLQMNNHIDPATASNLVSYWRFNEGAGTNTIDLKSGNDATLNGNSWDTLVPFNPVPDSPIISNNQGVLTSSAIANNQWNLNGNSIPNATNQNYTPTVIGDYSVTVTSTDGCTATSAIYTVTVVGIQALAGTFEVIIYPNPIIDDAVISINSPKNYSNISLMMFDISGKMVQNKTGIILSAGNNKLLLNKGLLSQGLYFYQLTKDNSTISKGKIAIN